MSSAATPLPTRSPAIQPVRSVVPPGRLPHFPPLLPVVLTLVFAAIGLSVVFA